MVEEGAQDDYHAEGGDRIMKRLQRAAVLLSLIEKLRSEGSWCGETHVQKATYFLEELLGVPLGFDFTLYKHGPYSFDLSDEITALRADRLLKLDPQPYLYGPHIIPGDESGQVKRQYPSTIEEYSWPTTFVAKKLGRMNVADLERVATALYVIRDPNVAPDVDAQAQRIHELKPHVMLEAAYEAVKLVDCFIAEVHELQAVR